MRIVLLTLFLVWAASVTNLATAEAASPFGFLGIPSRGETTTVAQANSPGPLAKMSDSTKRFVSNTTSVFTPKKPPVKRTGTTKVIKAKRPEPPKQGFFKSLFYPEPPPPPKTINDFMSMKQVLP